MTKEFKISDILNAVKIISKIEKRQAITFREKNDSDGKLDILPLNNQVKSDKSEILVLDQMIE